MCTSAKNRLFLGCASDEKNALFSLDTLKFSNILNQQKKLKNIKNTAQIIICNNIHYDPKTK
jgi:hypothetical protein